MLSLETWEKLSYIVTVVGLPFGIAVFLLEQRRQRLNDEEEVYQRLADEYTGFQKLVLEHSDLQLNAPHPTQPLTPEQEERKRILFDVLTSLFERAYILVYEDRMNKQQARLWQTWEDFMRVWCRRADYRTQLADLLVGEDPDFAEHIRKLAAEEAAKDQSRHPHPTPPVESESP